MTVTLDDSTRLQQLGIVLLQNLSSVPTITLLQGKDDTICLVDDWSPVAWPGIFIMVFYSAVRTTLFVWTCCWFCWRSNLNFYLFQAPGTQISSNIDDIHSNNHQLHCSHRILGCVHVICYNPDSLNASEECWYGVVWEGALTSAITAKLGIIQAYLFPFMVL